jgi:hypothetical protein
MSVNWTSLNTVCIQVVTAGETSSLAIIWIGVNFSSLMFKEGSIIAFICCLIINHYGISNYHIEIQESCIRKLSGSTLLELVLLSDLTSSAHEPFTATLGSNWWVLH